jgi:hypothetical protein
MKFSVVLLPLVLVAGCATDHGSWLDEVGKQPKPPVAMSADEVRALTTEATALRTRADAIRARMALEKDRVQRFRLYTELRKIDDTLNPIERRLWEADKPARPAALAPAG